MSDTRPKDPPEKCPTQGCNEAALEPHVCPYSYEFGECSECECCAKCSGRCAMDI